MVKPSEIEKSISNGEGQRTEFKKSFAEDNEAIRTMCAFANAEGGTVYFGITKEGRITGVDLGRNTLENFANKLKTQSNPSLSPSIERVQLQGEVIVAVTVQQAREGQLFYAFNLPYIRVGRTNQVMSSEEQRARLLGGGWTQIGSNAPVLVSQAGLTAVNVPVLAVFSWAAFKNATGYQIQVCKAGPEFFDFSEANLIVDEVLNLTSYPLSKPLDYASAYAWRVRALTAVGASDWSAAVGFRTEKAPPPLFY